jgi:pyruvate formate lyase activating enzyme
MTTGIIFDIKEFTVHDGPGIRTTVFMKGCPLSCMWCHNPEGQSMAPQVVHSAAGERLAGQRYAATDLAELLNRQADILRASEGGITFSGGEPLLQAEFVAEVIELLSDVHVVLDTSGFGDPQAFHRLIDLCDLMFFDLKLIDPAAHRHYTGRDNDVILENLHTLSASGRPFVVRVPLVPGVTDTDKNLAAVARTVCGLPGLQYVELLPYNRAAGSKYESVGMEFKPDYDEACPVHVNTALFEQSGVKVRVG